MKTLTCFLLAGVAALPLLAAPAQAQRTVANASFETWAGSPEKPAGWLTTDDVYAAIFGVPVATGTVVKSIVAHTGAFAAQLQTTTVPVVGTNAGNLILGTALRTGPNFEFEQIGQGFTVRPASLQFYYRLSGRSPGAHAPRERPACGGRPAGPAGLSAARPGGHLYAGHGTHSVHVGPAARLGAYCLLLGRGRQHHGRHHPAD